MDDVLRSVWWLSHTLARGESGRSGWQEVEGMLDRLGIAEPWARDGWRQAIWVCEDAAAYGQEVRFAREEEEREERRGQG